MEENKHNIDQPAGEEQELDLVELIRKLWLRRKLIIWTTVAGIVLGLCVGLTSTKAYTAGCVIVPQSTSRTSSSLSRLASLAGVNMSGLDQAQVLSPLVYPNIMENTNFRLDLLRTEIDIKEEEEPVTLLTYLSDKKYRKFSLTGTILKYTLGLPGLIKQAIAGEKEEQEELAADTTGREIIVLTKEELSALKALSGIISMSLEEKKGYITLTAVMPEPYAAAQVAESAQKLLERYVTEFKIQKVASNLDFMQERYDETKREYERIQALRAQYRDAHQNISTSRARTEMEKLDNQYNIANQIFSEIALQLEQAKIEVKKTMPLLTVINPVTMPTKPSKPRKMLLLAAFTVLGCMAGCGWVLVEPVAREIFTDIRRKEETEPAA